MADSYLANETARRSISWLAYPAWHTGLTFDWIREVRTELPLLARYNLSLTGLPAPEALPTSTVMHELGDAGTTGYTIVTGDVSGEPLDTFYRSQWYSSGNSSGLGLNHLPENACIDESTPRGPLHPRTYLLLLYRADMLSALRAAGRISSVEPPDDWASMVALLEAHAVAVSAEAAATAAAAAAGSSKLRPPPAASTTLPRYGLCVSIDVNCGRLGDVYAAIAASVVQTRGSHQGFAFDLTVAPPAAVPMVNGTGWRYAAELLRRLLVYNAPHGGGADNDGDDDDLCWGISPAFLAGDCLMTMEWDAALPLLSNGAAALQRPGAVGVAPLPGSRLVVTHGPEEEPGGVASTLMPCTPDICAVSFNHDALYLHQPSGTADIAAATEAVAVAQAAVVETSIGHSVLPSFAAREAAAVERLRLRDASAASSSSVVNRAPYSAAYATVMGLSYLDMGYDTLTIGVLCSMKDSVGSRLARFRTGRQAYTDALRRPLGYTVRTAGDEQNCTGYAGTAWWAAVNLPPGGNPPDVRPLAATAGLADSGTAAAYLRALWHALHSPNAAPDLQSAFKVNWFRYALSHAGVLLLPSSSADTTVAAAVNVAAVNTSIAFLSRFFTFTVEAYSDQAVRGVYEESISAPPWQPPPQESQALDAGEVAVIAAVAAAVAVLAAAGGLLYELQRRRRRRHRDLLGRVLAPRAGPDTTLLITDVQNSTVLWEQLPVAVMDATLKLHHGTIRRVLEEHDGYESATEGDSFILAFPDATKALAFATDAQLELMLADWPPELLAHPDGAPLVVLSDPRAAPHARTTLGFPLPRAAPSSKRISLTGIGGGGGASGAAGASGGGGATAPGTPRSRVGLMPARRMASPALPSGTAPVSEEGPQSWTSGGPARSHNVRPASTGSASDAALRFLANTPFAAASNSNATGGAGSASAGVAGGMSRQSSGAFLRRLSGAAVRFAVAGPPELAPRGLAAPPPFPMLSSCEGQVQVEMSQSSMAAAIVDGPSERSGIRSRRGSLDEAHGSLTVCYSDGQPHNSAFRLTQRPSSPAGVALAPALPPGVCGTWREMLSAAFPQWTPPPPSPPMSALVDASVESGAHGCKTHEGDGGDGGDGGAAGLDTAGDGGAGSEAEEAAPPLTPGVALSGEGQTWRERLCVPLPDGRPGYVVYRGLRVRMGLHTGLDDPAHVTFNKVLSTYTYSGAFADVGKLVSDAAPGGLITLSSSAFARLRNSTAAQPKDHHQQHGGGGAGGGASSGKRGFMKRIRLGRSSGGDREARGAAAAAAVEAAPVVVYCGHHVLKESDPRPSTQRGITTTRLTVLPESDDPDGSASGGGVKGGAGGRGARRSHARGGKSRKGKGVGRDNSFSLGSIGSTAAAALAAEAAAPLHPTRPHSLFLAVPQPLLARLAISAPLRTLGCGQRGSLEAPVGFITVAFMKVVGASTLLAELPGPASRALDQYQSLCCRLLGGAGGYLVEGGDGLVLAAFKDAAVAVEWALDSLAGLKRLEWDEELLEHELCAVGLDVGDAAHTLTEASGRLSYRGKVMNRAARIAGIAGAGQVLCSGAVWEEAADSCPDFLDRVVGCCLGRMPLKGISTPVEVVQCLRA
ncbi:hypothetical protein GPECTOR_9g702 [Gonium pectorale]|uniref:Guanylate cyclase domain-containing protein n=1 Tax=Gonium pectorale TaxID=33097 RepID=A0A150GS36_GONPE|nr:hypothetical protein GPECTOR_9g702 [Gonium pectorale]|eukprot:KXZ52657.1 hypothetical protein GPECTOR_9g702 [Gonium pectorale]